MGANLRRATSEVRWLTRAQHANLELLWGDAFDAFTATLFEIQMWGAQLASEPLPTDRPAVWHVLLDLHSRASMTAAEVDALHRSGYPHGAAARERTLHECAVVAYVIQDGGSEIAERYLDYEHVEVYHDQKEFQLHHQELGYEPLEESELREAQKQYDAVVRKYGADFKRINGWAAPLFPPERRKQIAFKDLEALAQLAHNRPYYRFASHSVHVGPRGAINQRTIIDGVQYRTPGGTAGVDLAEVAQGAIISLFQVHSAVMTERTEDGGLNSIQLARWRELQGRVELVGELFVQASKRGKAAGRW